MREAVYKGWLPQALAMGVGYDTFWSLNPLLLQPFYDAFKTKTELQFETNNVAAWLNGMYVLSALGASFGKKSYPEKPFNLNLTTTPEEEKTKKMSTDAARFYAWSLEWNKMIKAKHKKEGGGVDG